MTQKGKKLKSLRMMGYEVEEVYGFIRVTLRTKGGLACTTNIRTDEIYLDFIIEELVNNINQLIKNQL